MTTPIFSLDELTAAQVNKYITINNAIRSLEQGAQRGFIIIDKDLTAPPGGESDGDAYIVGGSATGAWSGKDNNIAVYAGTGYIFIAPSAGMLALVSDESLEYEYSGSAWAARSYSSAIILDNNIYLQGKDTGGAAENLIGMNSSDVVIIGDAGHTAQIVSSALTIDNDVIIGTNPASSGAIRLENNAAIRGRNAANSANIEILKVGTGDTIVVDTSGNGVSFGGDLTVSAGSMYIGSATSMLGKLGLTGDATLVGDRESILSLRSKLGGSIVQVNVNNSTEIEFGVGGTLDTNPGVTLNASTGDITNSGDVTVSAGFINVGEDTELTISTGAVTATKSYHKIDTESDAATDDLDTINGGTEGDILIIRSASGARDTTVKHGTGNILLDGTVDFTLATTNSRLMLIFDAANWIEISRSV